MAGAREDYLIRLIEDLRIFVSRAIHLRDQGQLGQALQAVVIAQERLFARPAAEFTVLPLDEQLRLLCLDEPAESARAKCLAYSTMLEEGGNVMEARGRDDMAASAWQLALYVAAWAALSYPAPAEPAAAAAVGRLRRRVPAEHLQPPTKALLERLA
ncbi:MAG TPA: hypothetical protein VHC86_15135 [Opitutaceae bacterium]|nr:hypothetical protein [Opitutaceae bacterium]